MINERAIDSKSWESAFHIVAKPVRLREGGCETSCQATRDSGSITSCRRTTANINLGGRIGGTYVKTSGTMWRRSRPTDILSLRIKYGKSFPGKAAEG